LYFFFVNSITYFLLILINSFLANELCLSQKPKKKKKNFVKMKTKLKEKQVKIYFMFEYYIVTFKAYA
jgi:hypothetical protein